MASHITVSTREREVSRWPVCGSGVSVSAEPMRMLGYFLSERKAKPPPCKGVMMRALQWGAVSPISNENRNCTRTLRLEESYHIGELSNGQIWGGGEVCVLAALKIWRSQLIRFCLGLELRSHGLILRLLLCILNKGSAVMQKATNLLSLCPFFKNSETSVFLVLKYYVYIVNTTFSKWHRNVLTNKILPSVQVSIPRMKTLTVCVSSHKYSLHRQT